VLQHLRIDIEKCLVGLALAWSLLTLSHVAFDLLWDAPPLGPQLAGVSRPAQDFLRSWLVSMALYHHPPQAIEPGDIMREADADE
jgi:hypothetical protein